MTMHPIAARIIELRMELTILGAPTGKRKTLAQRDEIMRRSLVLGGMEEAASLAFMHGDISAEDIEALRKA